MKLLLAALSLFAAPQDQAGGAEPNPGEFEARTGLLVDKPLGIVNDQVITLLQVERAAQELAYFQGRAGLVTPEDRQSAFSDLLVEALFREGFRMNNLNEDLVERIVADEMQQKIDDFGSVSALVEQLARFDSNIELESQRRKRYWSAVMFQRAELGIDPVKGRSGFKAARNVPPREVRRYYEENQSEFYHEFRVSGRILMLLSRDDAKEGAPARDRLLALQRRIQSGELSFAEAARQHSRYKPSIGGSTGHIKPDEAELAAPIVEFLRAAPQGATSDPIELRDPAGQPVGWALVQVEAVQQEGVTPFPEVQYTILGKLLQRQENALLRATIAELRKRCYLWGENVDPVLDGLFQDEPGAGLEEL